MSTSRLDPILAAVKRRAAERRRKQSLERLKDIVPTDSWRKERILVALQKPELTLVAECMRRSPSAGVLIDDAQRAGTNPTRQPMPGPKWHAYADSCLRGGASALSVATEEDFFGGSLDDLQTVAHTRLPRLRADFVLDEGMVYESCLFGADAVVLIAAILPGEELRVLREVCRELGVACLVEVHDEAELARALELEPELVSVNARDRHTLALDLATVERLLPRLPTGPKTPLRVAQGGIRSLADLQRVRAAGAQVAVVGETLLRAPDPAALLKEWLAATSVRASD